MNVLYDISVLGFGQRSKNYQTGIYRVVESVATHLAQTDACTTTFCAETDADLAREFIVSHPVLSQSPRHFSARNIGLVGQYVRLSDEIPKASALKKLNLKSQRKAIHLTIKTLQIDAKPFSANLLRGTDVFHANGFSTVAQIKSFRNVQRFQTIYDLLPVIRPQYFTDEALVLQGAMQQLLDQMGRDSWAICISQATKDDLCEYTGLDPSRAFVTPLAADAQRFYPCNDADRLAEVRRRYQIPQGPYVLSLCTMEVRKNIDHVIRSFVRLVQEQKLPDLTLVLAGSKGWGDNKILNEIAGAGALRDRIVVTGYVEDTDLAPLYSGALAFVYPSLYEGFGLPPLEAMQCGTPVITSNTSSLPEVVGDAGVMLDPHDEDGLCQSLLALYQRNELRHDWSQKSLARAKLFSWERCVEATISAYRTATAQ